MQQEFPNTGVSQQPPEDPQHSATLRLWPVRQVFHQVTELDKAHARSQRPKALLLQHLQQGFHAVHLLQKTHGVPHEPDDVSLQALQQNLPNGFQAVKPRALAHQGSPSHVRALWEEIPRPQLVEAAHGLSHWRPSVSLLPVRKDLRLFV